MRFPHDPRATGLREYSREIELDKLETRFELRAKGLLASESLLPVETAYLEAINCVKQDPRGQRPSSRRCWICSALVRRRPGPRASARSRPDLPPSASSWPGAD